MSEHPSRFGRYLVEGVLGRGAMGLVYLAEDPLIGRRVAVKVIRAEPGLDPEEAEDRRVRFEREFRSAGTLSHPNIVTVYDVGHETGASFIAMEYVQGESLQQLMQRSTVLAPRAACDLLLQIAAGLDFAHQAGIVHRDVKPANILLSRDNQAKITDFGVAKQASVTLTRTGTVLGTPAYMSPEQITGAEITGASDQFSLAIIGYELLTGARPFAGEAAPTVLYKIVQEPPPPPSSLNQGLAPAVDAVLAQALAKKPSARFPSCVALVRALREALGLGIGEMAYASASGSLEELPSHDRDATIASSAGDFHLDPDPASRIVTGSYAAVRGKSRTGWVLGGLAALAIGAGAAYFALQARTTPPLVTTVSIGSSAPGAEIYIDGLDSGQRTPAVVELQGELGEIRKLELFRDGRSLGTRELSLDGATPSWQVEEQPTQLALHIITDPPGVEVRVDGTSLGTSPLVAEVGIEGTARLSLRRDGYRPSDEDLDLRELATQGGSPRIERTLAELPPPAQLVVRGGFAVELRVRGRTLNARPGTALALEAGRLTLELSQPRVGYREQREIVLEAGREHSIDLPRTVSVNVAAQPGNCTVSINGIPAEVTPFSRELVIGSHDFEFRWPEETRRVSVAVREDGQRVFEALGR